MFLLWFSNFLHDVAMFCSMIFTTCFHDSTRFFHGHCVQVRPRRVPWRCQRGRFTSRRLRSGARSCHTTCCPTAWRCSKHRWLLTPLLMNGTLFLMGKLTISMAMFNSYVKLPEGSFFFWIHPRMGTMIYRNGGFECIFFGFA